MEKNKLIAGIVAAAIAIIVLASVLMPVLNDATTTHETFINEGYFRMAHYDNTTDHTLTWTYESPNIVTVDGKEVTIGYNVPSGQVTIIADTNWILRAYTGSDGNIAGMSMITTSGGTTSAQVANSDTLSVDMVSGVMDATIATTSKSGTYTDLWLPSNDGQFTMKKFDKSAYINGDSDIVGYGLSRVKNHAGGNTSSPGYGILLEGTYNDGFTGTVWRGGDLSLSDVAIVATTNSSFIDLYVFDKITATATLTETVDEETYNTDTELTYNYVIVPYQVTAERSVHLTDAMSAILNVIPLLIIVAVLLGVVAVFILRRE